VGGQARGVVWRGHVQGQGRQRVTPKKYGQASGHAVVADRCSHSTERRSHARFLTRPPMHGVARSGSCGRAISGRGPEAGRHSRRGRSNTLIAAALKVAHIQLHCCSFACAQEGEVVAALWTGHEQARARGAGFRGRRSQLINSTSDAHDAARVTSHLVGVPKHGSSATSARRGSWRQPSTVESPSERQIPGDRLVRSRGVVAALAFTFSRHSRWD
jgi:hypothetical protein